MVGPKPRDSGHNVKLLGILAEAVCFNNCSRILTFSNMMPLLSGRSGAFGSYQTFTNDAFIENRKAKASNK